MFSDPDCREIISNKKILSHVLLQNEEKERLYNCQRQVGAVYGVTDGLNIA